MDLLLLTGIVFILVIWNNILRNVYQLPPRTHRYILEPFTEKSHLFTRLTNRFINFYKTLFLSSKNVIRTLVMSQMLDSLSNFGLNVKMICEYNSTNDIFGCKKIRLNTGKLMKMICGE